MSVLDFFKRKDKAAQNPKDADASAAKREGGLFASSILLSRADFSVKRLVDDLWNDWGIAASDAVTGEEQQTLVFDWDGMTAAISLMPAPVPNGEAVENAKTNYRWPQAVAVAQAHKAHLFAAILPKERPFTEAGIALVKLSVCCLKQRYATGIQTAGTVFQPKFYRDYAKFYFENELYPIMNLVFFGLYSEDDGKTFSSHTFGLKPCFGKDELEVVGSEQPPMDIMEMMTAVASYVVEEDVVLRDGETVGLSAEQKLRLTRSKSEVLEGETIKIEF